MRKHRVPALIALFAVLAVARTTPADDKPTTGSIKGVVHYKGDMSKANQIDRTEKDADSCGHERSKPSHGASLSSSRSPHGVFSPLLVPAKATTTRPGPAGSLVSPEVPSSSGMDRSPERAP